MELSLLIHSVGNVVEFEAGGVSTAAPNRKASVADY
jgi:hypothetical protein